MLVYILLCAVIELFVPLDIKAKVSLIVLLGFIAAIFMLRDTPKNETVLLLTERELLKFTVPIYVSSGLFVDFAGIDKWESMSNCEKIAVLVCIMFFVVAVHFISKRYRRLCKKIFEEETEEKNHRKELLQEIAKKLDLQSFAPPGENENVIKKTRFTTTMEEIKID